LPTEVTSQGHDRLDRTRDRVARRLARR
jgi:hypothetical protein